MNYNITHQENYSRGELLLRALFGWLYIALPHGFILVFLGLWSLILTFIAWWVVLFTGVYPRSFFSYQEKMQRWAARLNARFFNLADGYPAFGLDAKDDKVIVEIPYPERLGRVHLLLRTFFGFFYCILPHGFILIFRQLATMVLAFLAFWVVLFTGKYPEGWHEFNVGTLRWNFRVNLYINFMTDDYPPFSGQPHIKFKRVG
jgi:hypothetical protein